MTKISSAIEEGFYKFYFDEMPAPEFESWLYNAKYLEQEIGEKKYVELVSLN
jgi:hypothetical protein